MKTKKMTPKTSRRDSREAVSPLRHSLTDASLLLGVSKNKLRGMAVDEKEFTVVRDELERKDSPVASKIYLLADEVSIYATAGLAGLRVFRFKKGRTK